jgi:hypothetical protein
MAGRTDEEHQAGTVGVAIGDGRADTVGDQVGGDQPLAVECVDCAPDGFDDSTGLGHPPRLRVAAGERQQLQALP